MKDTSTERDFAMYDSGQLESTSIARSQGYVVQEIKVTKHKRSRTHATRGQGQTKQKDQKQAIQEIKVKVT